MAGHKISRRQREAIRRGQTVRLYRGFRRNEPPPRPAGPCRKIDPVDGTTVIVLHGLGAKDLRTRRARIGWPRLGDPPC
ncbi:hypothetical protein ACVW1C_007514 [Bradyrhizobium sp. USDA 4011]